jgi:hypothetical protein
MTSAYSKVYVSSRSGQEKKLVLDGDNMDDLAMTWLDSRTLQISYTGGTIDTFTNEWRAQSSSSVEPDVEILLHRANVR